MDHLQGVLWIEVDAWSWDKGLNRIRKTAREMKPPVVDSTTIEDKLYHKGQRHWAHGTDENIYG